LSATRSPGSPRAGTSSRINGSFPISSVVARAEFPPTWTPTESACPTEPRAAAPGSAAGSAATSSISALIPPIVIAVSSPKCSPVAFTTSPGIATSGSKLCTFGPT
jgi:hypothetical protein